VAYNLVDYGERLLDHYENPRNAGDLDDADAVATVENQACGDVVRLALRISGGIVADVRFKASGCAAAIAAASAATELIIGRKLEEAAAVGRDQVAGALGGLPPAKVHCSILAEQAIRKALEGHGGARRAPDDTSDRSTTT
jgi:nitrogen fixation NifU-like protein